MKSPSSTKKWWVSEGTRKFVQAANQAENYTIWNLIHGYVYARWPYLYIGIGKGEHPAYKYLVPLWDFYRKLNPAREPAPFLARIP